MDRKRDICEGDIVYKLQDNMAFFGSLRKRSKEDADLKPKSMFQQEWVADWHPGGKKEVYVDNQVFDRILHPGMVVTSKGRHGVCLDVTSNATLRVLSTEMIIPEVDAAHLTFLPHEVNPGTLVQLGNWVGLLLQTRFHITVVVSQDGSHITISEDDYSKLEDVNEKAVHRGNFNPVPFYIGQKLRGKTDVLPIKGGGFDVVDAQVESYKIVAMEVRWIFELVPESMSPKPPSTMEQPQLNSVLKVSVKTRDSHKYRLNSYCQYIVEKKDAMKSISEWQVSMYNMLNPSIFFKVREEDEKERPKRSSMLYKAKKLEQRIQEQAFDIPMSTFTPQMNKDEYVFLPPGVEVPAEIYLVSTKAKVLWQDGSLERGVLAAELHPVSAFEHGVFCPNDFVARRSEKGVKPAGKTEATYGLVRNVHPGKRVTTVSWVSCQADKDGRPLMEVLREEQVDSALLEPHPRFGIRVEDMVRVTRGFDAKDPLSRVGQVMGVKHPGMVEVRLLNLIVSVFYPDQLTAIDPNLVSLNPSRQTIEKLALTLKP